MEEVQVRRDRRDVNGLVHVDHELAHGVIVVQRRAEDWDCWKCGDLQRNDYRVNTHFNALFVLLLKNK